MGKLKAIICSIVAFATPETVARIKAAYRMAAEIGAIINDHGEAVTADDISDLFVAASALGDEASASNAAMGK